MSHPIKVPRGKTKLVVRATDTEVDLINLDDITAGDGARHDVIQGKGAASTQTTCNVFQLLEEAGIDTHFLEQINDITFRAQHVDMIPLELIARRIATGSMLDRFPDIEDGTVLDDLIIELFEKDDDNHDPLVVFGFGAGVMRRYVPNKKAAAAILETTGKEVKPGDFINEVPLANTPYAALNADSIERLKSITHRVFIVLEAAWANLGGVLFDFKIECGIDYETGKLLVADVIDSDSWRLRFDGEAKDKQGYRDGTKTLAAIKKDYEEVAALSGQLA